jgi:hypothetical protein
MWLTAIYNLPTFNFSLINFDYVTAQLHLLQAVSRKYFYAATGLPFGASPRHAASIGAAAASI